ncbi:hypothetical protein GCM10027074_77720 [Streptomyces deserti]
MQREQSSATPQPAAVTDLEVRFRSIAVSEIHDPGSNAEAEFTFKVNGQTQTFRDNDLGIGKTPINRRFAVRIPATSALNIAVSGTEHDVTSGDDTLPGFTRSFSAAQGFGIGSHSVRATNEHMTYLMDFEIRLLLGLFTTLTGTATLTTETLSYWGMTTATGTQRTLELVPMARAPMTTTAIRLCPSHSDGRQLLHAIWRQRRGPGAWLPIHAPSRICRFSWSWPLSSFPLPQITIRSTWCLGTRRCPSRS